MHEGWEPEWRGLFAEINDVLTDRAKAQLKGEIIMLTHNERLHDTNMRWHPKAEDLLWRPELQETEVSEGGMTNLRYRTRWKRQWLDRLIGWMSDTIPYCTIRYAF